MSQKTTIITGGTGGIGAATAKLLLERDPDRHVALVDLGRTELPDALIDDFAGLTDRILVFDCDVSDEDSVDLTAAKISDEMPAADSLVNTAGIVRNFASTEMPIADFRKVFSVHVDGTLMWCQRLAWMLDGRPGSIVNVGSVSGLFGHPRRVAYAAAKAAIHSVSKTLAVEWAPIDIRVNAIAPGYVATPLMQEVTRLGLTDGEQVSSWAAMKRMATPDEIAGAIAFLIGDDASFVTGSVMTVDGGFSSLKAE